MALAPSILTNFIRWIRLKIYQYEVTFAIYMLTPTEKIIFSTSPKPQSQISQGHTKLISPLSFS